MANDIFTRAKAYRKKHPKTPWAQCVKACAGKKSASVGKAKRKSPKTVVRAKVAVIGGSKKKFDVEHHYAAGKGPYSHSSGTVYAKTKKEAISKTKKSYPYHKVDRVTRIGNTNPVKKAVKSIEKALGIGSIAMTNIKHNQQCIARHTKDISRLKNALKVKGLPAKDKVAIRRDIARYQDMIRTHKSSINGHKKHLY